MTRNVFILVIAVVTFILAAISAQSGDEVVLNGLAWLGVGGALFAAAHLP